MDKLIPSFIMYALATIVACGSGWVVWIIYNDPLVGPNDRILLWILAVVLALFSLWTFVTETFGDWILKKMYGEFSNRNPWGR